MEKRSQKKISVISSPDRAGQGAEGAILFLITICPLLLFDGDTGVLHIQTMLLFVNMLVWLLWEFCLIRKKEWHFPKSRYVLDLVVAVMAVFELLQILFKIVGGNEKGGVRFDVEVTLLSFTFLYFLLSSGIKFYEKYLDGILFSGLIAEGMLLYYYTAGGSGSQVAILIDKGSDIASYMVLLGAISLFRYLFCKEKMKKIFYAGVSLLSYLLLFISESRIGIWIMVLVFLAVPVVFRPTAELVKKDMQLFFAYMFLLSNMSLIGNYTHIVQKELHYDLEHSVYLELILALLGVLFFHYWDRIPKEANPERLVLRKMRKGYQFLLKLAGILLLVMIVGGESVSTLPDGRGLNVWKGFALPLTEEVKQGQGLLYFMLKEQGLVGAGMVLVFCTLLIARLRRRFAWDKPRTGFLILLTSVLLVQCIFWKPEPVVFTLYVLLMCFAVFSEEERMKVSVKAYCKEDIIEETKNNN